MNWLDQLYQLRDELQNFWSNPKLLLAELQANHVLLLEVVAAVVILIFLLYVLLRPTKKVPELNVSKATPTVQKANTRIAEKHVSKEPKLEIPMPHDAVTKSVKAVQEETRQRQLAKAQEEKVAKEKAEAPWQDLSKEEEAALAQAMQAAGKQAVAEIAGAPRQVEFFEEENPAQDAAKKMFSKTKLEENKASPMQMPLKKAPAARLDFLMVYYMAPRSQTYKVRQLFSLFENFNLHFNEDNVFEYTDQQGLQFYIASALKPGTFDVTREGETPGLSFIIDLTKVADGRGAFNKMLIFIDALSKQLKGDILDERRQRMTTVTMNEYLARIRSFNNTYQ
jgi:FtsZ-interacting cell division protein ZipA